MTLPSLATTAIGSVPFLDVQATLDLIQQTCPLLPHWPQLVHRHPREDMILQVTDGLPLLEVNEEEKRISIQTENREEALTRFYEKFLEADYEYFRVTPEAEVGLTALLDKARADSSFGPEYLKGELTGPVTFGLAVRTPDDRNLVDDPELVDTVVKGLGAKAAWLARQIRATGRKPLIFFDEPGLTGFGSAFSTLDREQVVRMLDEAAEIARSEGEVLLGSHVCGNTDWGLLTGTSLDVINFDAFGHLEHFLLYPRQIKDFLERGGYIAWGIVPTLSFTGQETAADLAARLKEAWSRLTAEDVPLDLIRQRALITPACGLGSLSEEVALRVYNLLPAVAERLH